MRRVFLAAVALGVAFACPALADEAALYELRFGVEVDEEKQAPFNGSTPFDLGTIWLPLGFDGYVDRFAFGGELGPRRTTGVIGSGFTALDVSTRGLRAELYGGYEVYPAWFVGLAGAYQLDDGALGSAFVGDLEVELETGEISPFVAYSYASETAEAYVYLAANLARAWLELEGTADDAFDLYEAELTFDGRIDLTRWLYGRGLIETRYIFKEDVALGAGRLDRFSAKFSAGLGVYIEPDVSIELLAGARAFDAHFDERSIAFYLRRSF